MAGPLPEVSRIVVKPRYMLVNKFYSRDKPLVDCRGPNYKGKGVHPGAWGREPRLPEKEIVINPINPRDELATLAVRKLSLLGSILNHLVPFPAGSTEREAMQKMVIIIISFYHFIIAADFKQGAKGMIM